VILRGGLTKWAAFELFENLTVSIDWHFVEEQTTSQSAIEN
jgi:hypothetical protein